MSIDVEKVGLPTALIIGDSYVEGVGSDFGGWATIVIEEQTRFVFRVWGKGGATSRDLLSIMASKIPLSCELIIIEIGLNDSRFRPSQNSNEIPIDEFTENIAKLIDIGLKLGVNSVKLVKIPFVDERKTRPYKEDKYYLNNHIDNYNYAINQIIYTRKHVHLIDCPDLLGAGLLSDGLHPSDEGHRAIARQVLKDLLK